MNQPQQANFTQGQSLLSMSNRYTVMMLVSVVQLILASILIFA